jgi:hypothetical protein
MFDNRDRILLVRQRDVDLWGTPGGSIDPYETPANTLVRESGKKPASTPNRLEAAGERHRG